MNFCPQCGLNLKRIQEAIEKEKEIWRPWDYVMPNYYHWTISDATADDCSNLYYKITVT